MPDLRIPIRSGPHRIAAIALYRALLTQCRAAPLETIQRYQLQNIVRNRIKQARRSQSVARLRISFQAGYEAIDQLDAAVAGDESSKRYISELIDTAPARIKAAPSLLPTPLQTSNTPANQNELFDVPARPKSSIFDRPLPLEQLSGKRHIPVLFNANHIPVLRIKKPQPPSLSRFLRQRIEQRQNRHDRRWRLYGEQALAAREDEWDHLVASPASSSHSMSLGRAISRPGGMSEEEPMWVTVVEDGINEVQAKLTEERKKNAAMAEKMQAVVDRETALHEEERRERHRVRRRAYRRRRKERSQDGQQALVLENGVEEEIDLAANG